MFWRGLRRVLWALGGAVFLAVAGALIVAGSALSYTFPSSGAVTSAAGSVSGAGTALVSEGLVVRGASDLQAQVGRITLTAVAPEGREVFLGLAPEDAVFAYLDGAAYDVVYSITPDGARQRTVPGGAVAAPPATQQFWVAQASGPRPTVDWPDDAAERGYRFVVMNADGSPGVAATVEVGFVSEVVYPASLAAAVVGVLALIPGVWMMYRALRRRRAPAGSLPPPAGGPLVAPTGEQPTPVEASG